MMYDAFQAASALMSMLPTVECALTSTTALQDVILTGRARFVEVALEQQPSTPTVSDVCEVPNLFYADLYAQHLKQDWPVNALHLSGANRVDMEHIGAY